LTSGGSIRSEDVDLLTDFIDECLGGNQIVEIEKGRYALIPHTGSELFKKNFQSEKPC